MAPSRDDYQLQEEAVLYSSLCLLEAQNAEGAKQIDIGKGMFRKPNSRAFELVLYHSYSVIRGKTAAKKYFKGLWPLNDKDRKQNKEFYQKAQDWLKETGQLEAHGNSLQSFIRNPSGPKLVSFLCDLTFSALQAQHGRLCPSDVAAYDDREDPDLLLALAQPLIATAKAQNQLQAQRLIDACHRGSKVQQQAEQVAAELRDLFYSLTAQLKETQATSEVPLSSDLLFSMLESSVTDGQQHILPALPQLPPALQAQQQELEQLWAQLEGHCQQFAGLAGLIDGLASSDTHPHAIDGAQLRQAGQLPGAPSTAGLDIAAMMEAWLVDVGAVCRYIKYLAGQPDADLSSGHHHQQHHSWGSGGGAAAAGSRGSSVTPLLATSDASSHAPHLYAQLGLHRNCLEHIKGMKSALGLRMAAAAERIQQLEAELYSLMAAEEQQCLAAMAAAGSVVTSAEAAADTFHLASLQPSAAAPTALFGDAETAAEAVPAAAKPSLFNGGSLQLVPPTPMLQQLVQKQRDGGNRLQHQQDSHGMADAVEAEPVIISPGRLSFGSDAESMGGRSGSISPPIPPAAVSGLVESPRLGRTVGTEEEGTGPVSPSGSISSVGSMSCPAAALLMSQDIMDLQLIDDDDLYVPSSPAVRGVEDPLRMSMLRLSIRNNDDAAAVRTAAATAAAATTTSPSAFCAQQAAGLGGVTFSLPKLTRLSSQGCLGQPHGDDTPPHVGHTHMAAVKAGHDIAQEVHQEQASAADVLFAQEANGQDTCDTMASISASVAPAAYDSSPVAFESAHLDPIAALPTGSDRMSSARPRRLTFAAAVSVDGSSIIDSAGGGRASPSGSSSSSGGGRGTEADSASSRQQSTVELAGQRLSLLRQRFLAMNKP